MTTPLPGQKFRSNVAQYSGYLNASSTRFLHYWSGVRVSQIRWRRGPGCRMIESAGNPKTDPIILWFNGGPGCTALLGLSHTLLQLRS